MKQFSRQKEGKNIFSFIQHLANFLEKNELQNRKGKLPGTKILPKLIDGSGTI
jgi:hypothetical protein